LRAALGYAAAEVAPVVTRLREMMLASARIFADETVVPVLDPGRGRTKKGYFWAIARDDRPWGGGDPPAVVYNYAPGRGHVHADALLASYRGILQCDGYAAYKKLAGSRTADGSITLAFCWSHVRRGFYDLAKTKAPIAVETLKRIAALYKIEERVRGKSAADRRSLRQTESKPLVAELRVWFEAQIEKLPARGPTAEAIRYALNHWDGLERFLEDGRIELDTNSVERAMRPVPTPVSLCTSSLSVWKHWKLVIGGEGDTGALYARPPASPTAHPGPRHGSGTARPEQPARREGSRH
jgi:transposase